jgi:hypothetical protein
MAGLKVFTWHVHGSYLHSLAQTGHELFIPVKPGDPEGYGGVPAGWPDTIHEVPVEDVPDLELDVVLFQSARNWIEDQFETLSPSQRALPRVYVEHDPPRGSPTDTRHVLDDPDVLLVHVTAFNDLMWDSGRTPTRVIEHGVTIPEGINFRGDLQRGIVVVNNLQKRGRRLGLDIFELARTEVPLDLVGMNAEALGGLGEFGRDELPDMMSRYRFFFHPIRYTSFGMAVCEAMMVGMPIVALATTEMPTVIENGASGFISNDPRRLVNAMHELLADRRLAARMGEEARRIAHERFGIARFAADWDRAFRDVAGAGGGTRVAGVAGPRVAAEANR